jgi:hypothetical protein
LHSWVIQLQWNTGEPPGDIDRLLADLEAQAPVESATRVAGVKQAPRITVFISAEDVHATLGLVTDLLARQESRFPELGRPVSVRVTDRETYLAAEARPELPDLISSSAFTDQLGITKQRASQLRKLPGWPEPVLDTGRDFFYLLSDAERYRQQADRTPGRPRKPASEPD